MVGTMVTGCPFQMSWCDLDLILPVVTLTFRMFSGLYLRNCNVQEVDTW